MWNKVDKDEKMELDLLVDNQRLLISVVTNLIGKGLGQRISQMAVRSHPFKSWLVDSNPPKTYCESIIIGLKLNPETALSIIEKGPEANLPEVKIILIVMTINITI